METNKIIIWTNPTVPFQKIYVMKDGVLVDQMGVKFDDVEAIVYELANKYDIQDIHFSGANAYGEKIAKDIEKNEIAQYGQKYFNIKFI